MLLKLRSHSFHLQLNSSLTFESNHCISSTQWIKNRLRRRISTQSFSKERKKDGNRIKVNEGKRGKGKEDEPRFKDDLTRWKRKKELQEKEREDGQFNRKKPSLESLDPVRLKGKKIDNRLGRMIPFSVKMQRQEELLKKRLDASLKNKQKSINDQSKSLSIQSPPSFKVKDKSNENEKRKTKTFQKIGLKQSIIDSLLKCFPEIMDPTPIQV
eukprot:TRINITY_DN2917_c0_g1_i2.p3 TRINITY_DN2917_c0_g1~~TRINITY_DN2917_c0_g1_i2.p3  ORF type:complete len:213 (+),score=97.23 TRINITY_DN2917_c0_g1_i2:221-859(+)